MAKETKEKDVKSVNKIVQENNEAIINEAMEEKMEEEVLSDSHSDTIINNPEEKGYVKYRVERAKRDAMREILSKLGVESIDEAVVKLSEIPNVNKQISELSKKLSEKEQSEVRTSKCKLLSKRLQAESVFDAEALLHYVDIDEISINDNEEIENVEEIISHLKEIKPNFFGKNFLKTDSFRSSNKPISNSNNCALNFKDNISAIADYIKNFIN